MKKIILVIMMVSPLLSAIEVDVRYNSFANFIYQLDCVSGAIPKCSNLNYQKLWQSEFLKTEDDRQAISTWANTIKRYNTGVNLTENKRAGLRNKFPGINLAAKIRIASLQSNGVEDYVQRLELLTTTPDKLLLTKVVKQLFPRFEQWWNKTGKQKGSDFTLQMNNLLKQKKVVDRIEQFAKFYEVKLPSDVVVPVNLFYRPTIVQEPTSGQQIEDYAVSEFVDGEKTEARLDVVIHELCHFFFESTSDENYLKLEQAFLEIDDLSVLPSYNLLNETLATVMGNGIVYKDFVDQKQWDYFFNKELSFYQDTYIDRASKAIFTWFSKWIEQGKTLYSPKFVKEYAALLEKKFGDELTSPLVLFNRMLLVADRSYGKPFSDDVFRIMKSTSSQSSEGGWIDERMLRAYRNGSPVNAMVIVHSNNFDELVRNRIIDNEELARFKEIYMEKGKVLFIFKPKPYLVNVVLAGKDHQQVLEMVDAFSKLKELNSGFVSL